MSRFLLAFALLLAVGGCAVGPTYHKPPVVVPPAFKEKPADQPPAGTWKPAQPADASARTPWWDVYGDPLLSGLESELGRANQNIVLAEARFRAARAALRVARADYYPTVTAGATVSESRASANRRVVRGSASGNGIVLAPGAVTDYNLPIDFSY